MPKKKKAAKRPTKKPARASAKRASAKKPAKKPAGRANPPASRSPFPVTTGRGPGAAEIGRSLVSLFNQGQGDEVEKRWWSPEIESIEGMGLSWRGRSAAQAKNAQWMAEHVLHGGSAEGPFVGASGFSVRFRIDVEEKATGKRELMDEIGVYTVRDGKITREEFMYADAAPRAGGSLPG